jgi:hypothetical protein
MKSCLVGVMVIVMFAAFSCTRDGGNVVSNDADGFAGEEVEADIPKESCEELCAGKECGLLGECACGEFDGGCGISNKYDCNPETFTCECQPLCGPSPDFFGWECGDDGCGGSCGECQVGAYCDYSEDQSRDEGDDIAIGGYCLTCETSCTNLGLECGLWETGLEAVSECNCGTCMEGTECFDGVCDCVPDCSGRECGNDGCGRNCGGCADTEICSDEGHCICVPDCEGKICGDDGCNGQCGVPCEGKLVCVAGECITCLEDDDCDDGFECTMDSCTEGECIYEDQSGDCDDSNKCTQSETCVDGQCVGDEIDCNDGNDCTQDTCTPAQGCQHAAFSGGDCGAGTGKCVEGECLDKVPTCPAGWILDAARCYRPFDSESDEELSWSDAEKKCVGLGGHLASAHDEATNELLKAVVAKTNFTNDTTWLGLNDIALEGAWKWSDGSVFDFTAWAGGQPNNWDNCWFGECPQNCVAIGDPMIGFGGWDDLECDDSHRYICQRIPDWN